MRVLKNIEWEDIEVGEVFAFAGCWSILEKVSKNKARLLATDIGHDFADKFFYGVSGKIYKFTTFNSGESRWPGESLWFGMTDRNGYCPTYLNSWGGEFAYAPLYCLPVSVQALWKEE